MRFCFIILAFLFSSSFAFGFSEKKSLGVRSFNITSEQGLTVWITAERFEAKEDQNTSVNTAEKLVVVLHGSMIGVSSRARAVLSNRCVSGITSLLSSQSTLELDLALRAERHSFISSGEFVNPILISSTIIGGDWLICRPEISFVVDGIWQTNPLDGNHNFPLYDL